MSFFEVVLYQARRIPNTDIYVTGEDFKKWPPELREAELTHTRDWGIYDMPPAKPKGHVGS